MAASYDRAPFCWGEARMLSTIPAVHRLKSAKVTGSTPVPTTGEVPGQSVSGQPARLESPQPRAHYVPIGDLCQSVDGRLASAVRDLA